MKPAAAAALLFLSTLGASCSPGGAEESWSWPRADVFLVVIDTLRADGLSSYGNPRATSPNLDRIASEGVLFETVYTQAASTAPSHATLFTGLHPGVHQVANLGDKDQITRLGEGFDTLADRYAAAGYQTVAITDGGPLRVSWGLLDGFETRMVNYEGAGVKVGRALNFLEKGRDERPLFLFLHTYEVHQPFVPPTGWIERFDPDYDGLLLEAEAEVRAIQLAGREPGWRKYDPDLELAEEPATEKLPANRPRATLLMRDRERFTARDHQRLRALYDAEIAYTDDELQRLWQRFEETGAFEDTILAITSDHGEEFGEHEVWGHVQHYREGLLVPLILRVPTTSPGRGPRPGTRVTNPVALVDLNPTLLAATGLAPGEPCAGIDLLEALRTNAFPGRPFFSSSLGRYVRQTVRTDGFLLLRDEIPGDRLEALYGDPLEERVIHGQTRRGEPVAGEPTSVERTSELSRLLDEYNERQALLREFLVGDEDLDRAIPPELLQEMDDLGYGGED